MATRYKGTKDKKRVMKRAHRLFKYDPTCMGDMVQALRKAWDQEKPGSAGQCNDARDWDDPEFTADDLDFAF